jgi:hypothetical protein
METRNREVPDSDPILDAPAAASSWRPLYRAAGMAALVTAVLIPIHLAVIIAYPMPDTVTGWFRTGPAGGLGRHRLSGGLRGRAGRRDHDRAGHAAERPLWQADPYTLIAADVVGFARYLPTVGVAIAAFSGLVLWVGAGSSSWHGSYQPPGPIDESHERRNQVVRGSAGGPTAPVPGLPWT